MDFLLCENSKAKDHLNFTHVNTDSISSTQKSTKRLLNMATTDLCSKKRGCTLLWACIRQGGIPTPIGRLTGGTINSTENTDSTGYFAGTCSSDQAVELAFRPDPDNPGEEILVDLTRFAISQDDGTGVTQANQSNIILYDACTSESTCTDEVNLTGDYCFMPAGTSDSECDPVRQALLCGGSCHLALYQLNPNGSLTQLYDGENARATSKNRTLAAGNDDANNFSITYEVSNPKYLNCFH